MNTYTLRQGEAFYDAAIVHREKVAFRTANAFDWELGVQVPIADERVARAAEPTATGAASPFQRVVAG